MMPARDRLIVALDVPDAAAAGALARRLAGEVGMFKVGSQLFTAAGPAIVRDLVTEGQRVFLDLKFHDIPNTVAGAAAAAAGLGVSLVTVHAAGGPAMIEAAAEAVRGTPARVLAITVLTSLDAAALDAIGMAGGVDGTVMRLARLAADAGAHGVVASPHEVRTLRAARGSGFLVVTPGIRPTGAALGDQARAATPGAALSAGADYLVVGRPILAAPDPVAAARAVVLEMEAATAVRQ
jgi:orotidine-5'-phosphate decarboxylase